MGKYSGDPIIPISQLSSFKYADLQTMDHWVRINSTNAIIAVKHGIIQQLTQMIQTKVHDDILLKYALSILDQIASHPNGYEVLSESSIIPFIIKNILIPNQANVSIANQTNMLSLVENMANNMFGFGNHHQNKDLYLKNGLLKYIVPLCSAKHYGFRISKVLSQLFATICQESYISTLRSRYYKQILHGLSYLLMFDDEYILSEVLPSYLSIFMIGGTFAGHQIILDEHAKPKNIINGFVQRMDHDKIVLLKMINVFAVELEIKFVPNDVITIIGHYFYVFDEEQIKYVHGNVLRRFVDLCGFDDYYIQNNALKIVNGLLKHPSDDRVDTLFEFGLRKQLMICSESDNESVKQSAWCIMFSIGWDRMEMITSSPLAAAFLVSGETQFAEYAEKMMDSDDILLVSYDRTPIEHVIAMFMTSIEYVLKSNLLTDKLKMSIKKIMLNLVNIDRDLMTNKLLHGVEEINGDDKYLSDLKRIIELPDFVRI